MFKIILPFIFLLFFSACAVKQPVTWQNRILDTQVDFFAPLAYKEHGDINKKTLLFLHGFGESKETWRFLVPRLSKHYHLLLLDLKGFGASPKVEDHAYSVYDQAKVVANFIEEKKLKDVTVVGRSFGGGVALVLALMQKDKLIAQKIERLILINSMAYKQNLPSMLKVLNRPLIGYLGIHLMPNDKMAEEAYRYAFYNHDLIPKESIAHSSSCLSQPLAKYVYLETVDQLIPDDVESMQKRYREIDLPVLILWGREDVSIGVHIAYRLHRDLQKSWIKTFAKAGHMPNEEIPNKVALEIIRFMEGH